MPSWLIIAVAAIASGLWIYSGVGNWPALLLMAVIAFVSWKFRKPFPVVALGLFFGIAAVVFLATSTDMLFHRPAGELWNPLP